MLLSKGRIEADIKNANFPNLQNFENARSILNDMEKFLTWENLAKVALGYVAVKTASKVAHNTFYEPPRPSIYPPGYYGSRATMSSNIDPKEYM